MWQREKNAINSKSVCRSVGGWEAAWEVIDPAVARSLHLSSHVGRRAGIPHSLSGE